jgi:hypothetical protein
MSLSPDHQCLISNRMSLAQTWRRRGKFDEVAFIFPNAPDIPITVVCEPHISN